MQSTLEKTICYKKWLREPDLNRRPSGYEPDELPCCSIPRSKREKFYADHLQNASVKLNGAEDGT